MAIRQSESLLAECALPGCHTPMATVGHPCDGCRTAFGSMLVYDPNGPGLTAEQIAERDRSVHEAYAWQAAQRRKAIR